MTAAHKALFALGLALSVFATGFGSGVWTARSIANNAQQEAMAGAAKEIAKLQITNTTTINKVREIIKIERVYTECKHSPETLNIIRGAY